MLSAPSRKPPIEVFYILLRIILAPAVDEPLTGYARLNGELDPVLLINFCDPFADVALPSMTNSFAGEI
jgi:hypothetical protein